MLTHPTIDKLQAMHLSAMATAFDHQRASSQHAELSFEDRSGLLVEAEWTAREQRRLAALPRACVGINHAPRRHAGHPLKCPRS